MSGMIQGGWEFVYAAYGITGGALVLYAFSLFVRLGSQNGQQHSDEATPSMQLFTQEHMDRPVAPSEDEHE